MKKKRAMSNSRDPNYHYKDMPVTSEEEEAWLLLAARESFELQEREAKKPKGSFLGNALMLPPLDHND